MWVSPYRCVGVPTLEITDCHTPFARNVARLTLPREDSSSINRDRTSTANHFGPISFTDHAWSVAMAIRSDVSPKRLKKDWQKNACRVCVSNSFHTSKRTFFLCSSPFSFFFYHCFMRQQLCILIFSADISVERQSVRGYVSCAMLSAAGGFFTKFKIVRCTFGSRTFLAMRLKSVLFFGYWFCTKEIVVWI